MSRWRRGESEEGPVADSRDPELVRRLAGAPVPDHQPQFWAELEAKLEGSDPELASEHDRPAPNELAPTVELSDRSPAEAGSTRSWSLSRPLLVAAAVLAAVGVGGAILTSQRSSGDQTAAANLPQGDTRSAEQPNAAEPAAAPPEVAPVQPTEDRSLEPNAAAPTSPSGGSSGLIPLESRTEVVGVGTGTGIAFSPDGSALIVFDDGDGQSRSCGGVAARSLYLQDLTTGQRRPAVDSGLGFVEGRASAVEPDRLWSVVTSGSDVRASTASHSLFWAELCENARTETWRGVLGDDGQITAIEEIQTGSGDDPFIDGDPNRRQAESPDGRLVLRLGETITVAPLADEVDPADDGSEALLAAVVGELPAELADWSFNDWVWSPQGDLVALVADQGVALWDPRTGDHLALDFAPISRVVFDPAGRRLAVSTDVDDGTISVVTFG